MCKIETKKLLWAHACSSAENLLDLNPGYILSVVESEKILSQKAFLAFMEICLFFFISNVMDFVHRVNSEATGD